jgi:hypothetical protein
VEVTVDEGGDWTADARLATADKFLFLVLGRPGGSGSDWSCGLLLLRVWPMKRGLGWLLVAVVGRAPYVIQDVRSENVISLCVAAAWN